MKKHAFNLEQAKKGAGVINELGHPVRILCFDAKRNLSIVTLVETSPGREQIFCYNTKGQGVDASTRLFMQVDSLIEKKCGNCRYIKSVKSLRVLGGKMYYCRISKSPRYLERIYLHTKACEVHKF